MVKDRRPVANHLHYGPDAASSWTTSRPGREVKVVQRIHIFPVFRRVSAVAVVSPGPSVLQSRPSCVCKACNAVPHVGHEPLCWYILDSPPRLTHGYVKRELRKLLHGRQARETDGADGK